MNLSFMKHLLTTNEKELYEFLYDRVVRGINSFALIHFVVYIVCSVVLYHAFSLRAHVLFGLSLVMLFVALKWHSHYYTKTKIWMNSEAGLLLSCLFYFMCGYVWWTAYIIYLIKYSYDDAPISFVAAGVVATLAQAQFSSFIRVMALTLVILMTFLILWMVFFPPAGGYYLGYWITLYAFKMTLIIFQHNNVIFLFSMKKNNLDLLAQLKIKNKGLEQANLMQSRYLSAASHDLRQPLHALSLIANNLQHENHDPKAENGLSLLNQAIGSLSDSFDAMLNLSRLDAGAIKTIFHNVPLQKLFDRLDIEFRNAAANKNLILKIVPSKLNVFTDEGVLYSILSNLVSNATRYTEPGGRILIGARRKSNSVDIWVCDTGVGIPPEKSADIFQEYRRLEYAQERVAGGVGLGLAISERMATLLKTKMKVESQMGRGSIFSIEIPLSQTDGLPTETSTPVTVENILQGKRVIVADDNSVAADHLVQLIESWGMDVSVVLSTEMLAEVMHEEGHIDLILSDYHLGLTEENGLELLKSACKIQPLQPPICILVTGDTTIELTDKAVQENIKLLHKPIRPARLRLLLNELFMSEHTQLAQENKQ